MRNISALIKETQIPNSSMYIKVKINSRVERNKIAIIIINTLVNTLIRRSYSCTFDLLLFFICFTGVNKSLYRENIHFR